MRADKIKTRACAGTPAHLHAYDPTEQDAWIQIHCLYALGGVSSEKPHAYLLRVACCSVCMAACRVAVHLATVDVCAIRSRKILSCGLPTAVSYALAHHAILPISQRHSEPDRGRRATTEDALPSLLAIL